MLCLGYLKFRACVSRFGASCLEIMLELKWMSFSQRTSPGPVWLRVKS